MAIVLTNQDNYVNIANAIRAKGVTGTFKPSEMPSAISRSETGTPRLDHSITFKDLDGVVVEIANLKNNVGVNPPTNVEADMWVDENGGKITFPYSPTRDIIISASHFISNIDIIYRIQGVDIYEYPYFFATKQSNKVYFSTSNITYSSTWNQYTSDNVLQLNRPYSSADNILDILKEVMTVKLDFVEATSVSTPLNYDGYTNYTPAIGRGKVVDINSIEIV